MSTYTVPKLALDAGVSVSVVRDHVLRGLLRPAGHTPGGYGLYDAWALERLHFVRALVATRHITAPTRPGRRPGRASVATGATAWRQAPRRASCSANSRTRCARAVSALPPSPLRDTLCIGVHCPHQFHGIHARPTISYAHQTHAPGANSAAAREHSPDRPTPARRPSAAPGCAA
ncbi:MerR family transcriptional regulator [Azospira restricta]|uniref:MerR family transcriptional regulator n=1 Tax=Azospira restricta TaxID=404405 RepID=A0A974Y4L1_9RHOO|nr:MerR family transcriptional regulator [Azospira restricta]